MFHTGSGSSPPLIAEMKKPAEREPGGPTGFGLYRGDTALVLLGGWPVLISGFEAIGVLGRRLVLLTTVRPNHTHLGRYTRAVSLPG